MVGLEHDVGGAAPDSKAAEAAFAKACDGGVADGCFLLGSLKSGDGSDMKSALPYATPSRSM
jgi:TPR repeat protein